MSTESHWMQVNRQKMLSAIIFWRKNSIVFSAVDKLPLLEMARCYASVDNIDTESPFCAVESCTCTPGLNCWVKNKIEATVELMMMMMCLPTLCWDCIIKTSAVAFHSPTRSHQPPRAADLKPANTTEKTDCSHHGHAEPRYCRNKSLKSRCCADSAETPEEHAKP